MKVAFIPLTSRQSEVRLNVAAVPGRASVHIGRAARKDLLDRFSNHLPEVCLDLTHLGRCCVRRGVGRVGRAPLASPDFLWIVHAYESCGHLDLGGVAKESRATLGLLRLLGVEPRQEGQMQLCCIEHRLRLTGSFVLLRRAAAAPTRELVCVAPHSHSLLARRGSSLGVKAAQHAVRGEIVLSHF